VFEYDQSHPRRAAIFDGAMTDFSRSETAALLEACSFEGIEHLVDVGGGRGELLMAMLDRYPGLRGTVFDQPAVVAPMPI
jgi:hypothetical protein